MKEDKTPKVYINIGIIVIALFLSLESVPVHCATAVSQYQLPASWSAKAPLPTARGFLAVAEASGVIYAVGGNNGQMLSKAEAYNPNNNTWWTVRSMPTARGWLTATAVNNLIYAIGGGDGTRALNTVEVYDPKENIWYTRANMPTPRWSLASVSVNGIIYVIGGYVSFPLNIVEAYNPVNDTWWSVNNIPQARSDLAAVEVNGIIYAIGGWNHNTGAVYNTVEAYNPTTNTWTTKSPMPTARYSLGAAVVNNTIYAIGGCDGSSFLTTVEAYSPANNTWWRVQSMPAPGRYSLGVTSVNGIIYAIGGAYYPSGGPWVFLNNVDAYAPYTAFLDHFWIDPIGTQVAGRPFQITLSARDQANYTFTSFTGTAVLSDTTGTISPPITGSFVNGRWSGFVTIAVSQRSVRISASAGGKIGTSNAFDVISPPELETFYIDRISSPQTAGVPFTLTLYAKNPNNVTNTSFTGSVSLSDTTGTISPTTAGPFINGQWIGQVRITRAMSQVRISVLDPATGTTNESNSFAVRPGTLANITVSPSAATLLPTQQITFTAYGLDAYNNWLSGVLFSWADLYAGGTFSPATAVSTTYTAGRVAGTYRDTLRVSNGTVEAYASVIIVPGPLSSIAIVPSTIRLQPAESTKLSAKAYDEFGNELKGLNFSWSDRSAGGVFEPPTGERTIYTAGTVAGYYPNAISVANGSWRAYASVWVNPGPVTDFLLSNIRSPQVAGTSFHLRIEAKDRFNNTNTSFNAVCTITDSTGTLRLSSAAKFNNGVWEGDCTITKAARTVLIYVSYGLLGNHSNYFTVEPAVLQRAEITPSAIRVKIGNTVRFTAEGFDAYDNAVDATFQWAVDSAVGTISQNGTFTATAAGIGNVTARNGTVVARAIVRVYSGFGAIAGRTVEENAAGLSGVRVLIKSNSTGSEIANGTTDENGNFLVLNIPEGYYDLILTKEGFDEKKLWNITVISDQTYNTGSVTLRRKSAVQAGGDFVPILIAAIIVLIVIILLLLLLTRVRRTPPPKEPETYIWRARTPPPPQMPAEPKPRIERLTEQKTCEICIYKTYT